MVTTSFDSVDSVAQELISTIPGPQEGESVFDYRARVNTDLMKIISAVTDRKKIMNKIIGECSADKLNSNEQFYNAVRRKFITDEFKKG